MTDSSASKIMLPSIPDPAVVHLEGQVIGTPPKLPPPAVVGDANAVPLPAALVRVAQRSDAESYLNDVKLEFSGEQSFIYTAFVELMKRFKTGSINTADVIAQVTALFVGHDELIRRFQGFTQPPPQAAPPQVDPTLVAGPAGEEVPGLPRVIQVQQADADPLPLPQFDHAIHYVTRIKRRFQAVDPNVYKKFLDILHIYQKERKAVVDVLNEVAELFQDHLDLLKDFAYFLPENVQRQAAQEIERIAARRKKDARLARQRKEPAAGFTLAGAEQQQQIQRPPRARRLMIQPTEEEEEEEVVIPFVVAPAPPPAVNRTGLSAMLLGKMPRGEAQLLAQIKLALGTRAKWGEFLRLLELFTAEVLDRKDLIALVADLGSFSPELREEFDRCLAARGVCEELQEDLWFSIPVSEIDYTSSTRPTPNYRSLPASYPLPQCSARDALCHSVLNDAYVAVVVDSDFGGRGRTNGFEDQLFHVEDDRYEMEMQIEGNRSALCALELILAEAASPLCLRRLNTLHLKAIARLYADQATSVLELMRKAPEQALPRILLRLKAKQRELDQLKVRSEAQWRVMDIKNFDKARDHRSGTFRRDDVKGALSVRTLLGQITKHQKESEEMRLDFSNRQETLGLVHALSLTRLGAEPRGRFTRALDSILNLLFTPHAAELYVGRQTYFFLRYLALLCDRLRRTRQLMLNKQAFPKLLQSIQAFACELMDQAVFEKEIQVALGNNFYLLLTVDRVVDEVFKSAQTLTEEEPAEVVMLLTQCRNNCTINSTQELQRVVAEALQVRGGTAIQTAQCSAACVTVKTCEANDVLLLGFPRELPQRVKERVLEIPLPVVDSFSLFRIGLVDIPEAVSVELARTTAAAAATTSTTAAVLVTNNNNISPAGSDDEEEEVAMMRHPVSPRSASLLSSSPRIKRLRIDEEEEDDDDDDV